MQGTRLASGTLVGAYNLVRPLGAGGMGEVWLAEHTMLGRRAAVKVLHEEISRRPEIVARFFNEARAATAISDPGIVQIFDFGHHAAGDAYIVMEMLDGESLEERLHRRRRLPLHDALRLVRQIAVSLGAAHARGIVHRDLKPDNIFIVADPEAVGGERTKILDFGIAKLTGHAAGVKTQTSTVMGTPTYMSPEQCRGAGEVDQRSDIYSLGCILFQAIAGRPPYDAEGPGDVIAMHLREAVPPLASGSPAVDAIAARCLAKSPGDRFASGTALAASLAAALEGAAAIAMPPRAAVTMRPTAPPPTTLSLASSQVHARHTSRIAIAYIGCALAFIGIVTSVVVARKRAVDAPALLVLDAATPDAAVDAALPDAAPLDAAPPDALVVASTPPELTSKPRPARVPIPRRPKTIDTCTAGAFLAIANQSDATSIVLQESLRRLRACERTLPDAVFRDLQQRLMHRLLGPS